MTWTLRAQIAAATGLVATIVVALAGALIAVRMDHRDRALVDAQLVARAQRVVDDVGKLVQDDHDDEVPGDDGFGDLLDDTESLVRLIHGSTVLVERGAVPDEPLAAPTADGLATVAVDGRAWRSYVVTAGDDVQVQVLQSLEPVDERLAANSRLTAAVTILAALISAAAGWLVGGAVLRPLARLSAGAAQISEHADPADRLPTVVRPAEIATLSAALNGMLDRLEAGTETTRRFAADVGHELRGPLTASITYLETMLDSPDVPAAARRAMLAAHEQQLRMVGSLSALQVLARVDAGAVPPPVDVELGLLADEVVRLARRRHPTVTYQIIDDSAGAVVSGWPDGLRIAIDNLLDNAALHGRPQGLVRVEVHAAAQPHRVTITVVDDGPGIPEHDRDLVLQRFARGSATSAPGTGLGLAIVQQQATLHHGSLQLSAGDHGGLRVDLSFVRSA